MRLGKVVLQFLLILALTSAASGCAHAVPTAQPAPTARPGSLSVTMLYPTSADSLQMGQDLKSIVRVQDEQENTTTQAEVTVSIIDPSGNVAGRQQAIPGGGDVYRTATLNIPHRLQAGTWTIEVDAQEGDRHGSTSSTLRVENSIGEDLLNKYGFWVDAPTLKGIHPDLYKERGDAQDGVIVWGGVLPTQHIFVENWLEIHWRHGQFDLSSADQVRSFILNDLGDIGFYPVRALGPFEQVKFKNWDAWQVKARGQLSHYDEQWMIFYSPKADKTYAICTMVALPPKGIDAHAALRDSFEVHPEVHAAGVAPAPLLRLLPPPELVTPELGARFLGRETPIVLTWKPLKDLAADEYYQVKVAYDYGETNNTVLYTTRETHVTLPQALYETPNCGVFNWQVTLMKQTGTDEDGQPEGEPLSYNSLYWYVEWLYPAGADRPFKTRCPNPQT